MQDNNSVLCPLCKDQVSKRLYRFHVESEKAVLERIKFNNPEWTLNDGICSRCVDYYHTEVVMQQRVLPDIGPHFPVKSPDDFIILPTVLRLDADQRFTGKGVTICFIDSGFYLHPDLIGSRNRVKKVLDITNTKRTSKYFQQSHSSAWHGTMTSVVCAGDGFMSKGLYKGIASDAELVLLKVQDDNGRITSANISKALQWVLKNHKKYDIRIVNMSLGGDDEESYLTSEIDQLAEQLIDKGIVLVAAVGNDVSAKIKPPANSLNVIAVGGVDDDNNLNKDFRAYHSTYGRTIDGLMKPELVANSIWLAAPILPGTREKEEAETLHRNLFSSPPVSQNDESYLRERIKQTKFFHKDYMHVDGTSFAAPIVSSVIAQLIEANTELSPSHIREILFSTATKLSSIPLEQQGFGYIRPRKAIFKTLKREVFMKQHSSPHVNPRKKTIEFYIHNDCAQQVSLAGSFNHWAQDVLLMEPCRNGMWKIEIPMLPKGNYKYKFFIDEKMWVEDVENPYREPDGFNGWNSLLEVN